jgi:hypothetical protein
MQICTIARGPAPRALAVRRITHEQRRFLDLDARAGVCFALPYRFDMFGGIDGLFLLALDRG